MFSDNQINITELPDIQDLEMTPLDQKYRYILLMNIIVLYGFGIAGLIIARSISTDAHFKHVSIYLICALIFAMLVQGIIHYLGFKKRAFAMREKDMCYSYGYLTNKTLVLPYNRIQHIEIARSFMARKLGLATLKIYSAGESGGDMVIHGLPNDIAESQYTFLTKIINEQL